MEYIITNGQLEHNSNGRRINRKNAAPEALPIKITRHELPRSSSSNTL